MNVTLINTNDKQGGAAVATYRLNCALHKIKVNSNMLVVNKRDDDLTIYSIANSKIKKYTIKLMIKLYNIYNNMLLYRYKNSTDYTIFSFNIHGFDIARHELLEKADIIHLHWVNGGFLSIKNINRLKLLNKPIVWTLHDMWAFTGGCHHSLTCKKYIKKCGKCPLLHSKRENDMTRKLWKLKEKNFNDLDLTVVTCSSWLKKCATKSSLFKNVKIEVIPNPINTSIFKPIDRKLARKILNINIDKFIICFGAVNSTTDKNKGYQYLIKALRLLSLNEIFKNSFELLVFGASHNLELEEFPFKTTFVGILSDSYTLALCYNAADIFVSSSVSENLPNTIMESLSCATPVVAFNTGGISDMVEHKINGYLALKFSHKDLYEGIKWVLEDEEKLEYLRNNARIKVLNSFTEEIVAKKYFELYNNLLL